MKRILKDLLKGNVERHPDETDKQFLQRLLLSEIANDSGKEFEVDLFEKMNPGLIERLSNAGIAGAEAGEELKRSQSVQ